MDSAAGYAQMNGILSTVLGTPYAQMRMIEYAERLYAELALVEL